MSQISDIEWLRTVHSDGVVTPGASWNPTRGCTKISQGCKHCYAETFAERWRGIVGHPYRLGFDPRTVPDKLLEPLRWRRGRKIFVDSMSDLFHDAFSNEYIAAVFGVIAACPWHTFIMLTKRDERLPDWFAWIEDQGRILKAQVGEEPAAGTPIPSACAMLLGNELGQPSDQLLGGESWRHVFQKATWPLPNLWLGVSVEDREHLSRIDNLRKVPVAVPTVSFEPLLEDLGPVDLSGVGWGIMGNESGPRCREGLISAIRNLLRRHQEQGVASFVKQLGGNVQDTDLVGDLVRLRLKSRKGANPAEWPEDLRVQQWPTAVAA